MKTIADIKEEYPQYANVPDVKLAGALYKKYYSDKDEDQFYKLVFPSIAGNKDSALEQTLSPEVDGIISPDDEMLNQERISNMSYKPSVKDIAIENDTKSIVTSASINNFTLIDIFVNMLFPYY